MRAWSLFVISLFLSVLVRAQVPFSIASIPADMLADTDAVVQKDSFSVEIVSLTEAYVTQYKAVTILNDKGYDQAVYAQYYNKFTEVDIRDFTVYDKNGSKIRSAKKSDIKDELNTQAAFIHDTRHKYVDLKYANYPFTIIYTVRIKFNSLFFLPAWQPYDDYNVSILNASANITYPAELALKYRAYNMSAPLLEATNGSNKTLSVSLTNLPARQKDKLTVPALYSSATLVLVPQNFTLEAYSGDFSTWKKMGDFYSTLNNGRDIIPANVRSVVHQLTDTCKTNGSKISLLYRYLQDNTRYVSIQLGIGGWQTFDANSVASNNYGDCKALSNYMVALLKEANVVAYPVLVRAGEYRKHKLDSDFANDVFNHVIVCVPGKKDSVWLECTADDIPAGYLSEFTSDRDVLMITPEGGRLLHTPAYGLKDNFQYTKTNMFITENGELKGNSHMVYSGSCRDDEFFQLKERDEKDIRKYLNRKSELPNYEIGGFSYKDDGSSTIPSMTEHVSFTGQAAINNGGNRVFISSFLNTLPCQLPVSYEGRKERFHVQSSCKITDTTVLHLAGAYTVEYFPEKVNVAYPFGTYQSQFMLEGDNIVKIIREYSQQEGNYEATIYNDYLKFRNKVLLKGTAQKIVLLKKT